MQALCGVQLGGEHQSRRNAGLQPHRHCFGKPFTGSSFGMYTPLHYVETVRCRVAVGTTAIMFDFDRRATGIVESAKSFDWRVIFRLAGNSSIGGLCQEIFDWRAVSYIPSIVQLIVQCNRRWREELSRRDVWCVCMFRAVDRVLG
jgi:hypothetical protein